MIGTCEEIVEWMCNNFEDRGNSCGDIILSASYNDVQRAIKNSSKKFRTEHVNFLKSLKKRVRHEMKDFVIC